MNFENIYTLYLEGSLQLKFQQLKDILKQEQIGEIRKMDQFVIDEDSMEDTDYGKYIYRVYFKEFYSNEFTKDLLYNIENNDSNYHSITFHFESRKHLLRVRLDPTNKIYAEAVEEEKQTKQKQNKQYAYLHITNENYQRIQRLLDENKTNVYEKKYFINMTFNEPIVVACNKYCYDEIMENIDNEDW
jgi:hypothetical protein